MRQWPDPDCSVRISSRGPATSSTHFWYANRVSAAAVVNPIAL